MEICGGFGLVAALIVVAVPAGVGSEAMDAGVLILEDVAELEFPHREGAE